jgi:hypothetical protein
MIQMSQRNQLQQNTIQRFLLVFKILRDGSRNFGSGVGQKNRKSISGAMRPTSQDWILKIHFDLSRVGSDVHLLIFSPYFPVYQDFHCSNMFIV